MTAFPHDNARREAVRRSADSPPVGGERHERPKAVALLKHSTNPPDLAVHAYIESLESRLVEQPKCPECKGAGEVDPQLVTCPRCGGSGFEPLVPLGEVEALVAAAKWLRRACREANSPTVPTPVAEAVAAVCVLGVDLERRFGGGER